MSSKDKATLLSMLDAVEKIQKYIQGISSAREYYQADLVFDATLMNLIILGEMGERLSSGVKEKHLEVDWRKIKDFRNLVARDYLGIDAEEVWQIINSHLPKLHGGLRRILEELQ